MLMSEQDYADIGLPKVCCVFISCICGHDCRCAINALINGILKEYTVCLQ